MLYRIIVTIHVLSAIMGLGPGFTMIYLVTKSKNMAELRQSYFIRNRIHIFVMIGGSLLLITGLIMGFMNSALFHMGWYVTSLCLFLITLAFGPIILSPRSKPIKRLLKEYKGESIPTEYYQMARRLFFWERVENVLFMVIIILMILKPF